MRNLATDLTVSIYKYQCKIIEIRNVLFIHILPAYPGRGSSCISFNFTFVKVLLQLFSYQKYGGTPETRVFIPEAIARVNQWCKRELLV